MSVEQINVQAADPVHAEALRRCTTKVAAIRYACAQVQDGRPTTQHVRDWLDVYGVTTTRSHASTVVNAWRNERGLVDTGDLTALSAEMLAELDELHGAVTCTENGQDAEARGVQDGADAQNAAFSPSVPSPGDGAIAETTRATQPPTTAAAAAADVPPSPQQEPPAKPAGAPLFYLAAVLGTLLSADTSYRFFGEVGISGLLAPINVWGATYTLDVERILLFSVVELALVACAVAMRANVRRWGHPGAPQWVAWGLLGFASVAALGLAGITVAGLARVAFGPLLALVMLHLALGIEVRVRRGRANGTWARLARELRERILSRLGLADDQRDAVQRTRDRAARHAAHLALAHRRTPFRQRRLRRALRVSNTAHDPTMRARLLAELATLRHANALRTLDQPLPW